MSKIRKQKQLEALFLKILEQVRALAGQVTKGGIQAKGHRASCPRGSDSTSKVFCKHVKAIP